MMWSNTRKTAIEGAGLREELMSLLRTRAEVTQSWEERWSGEDACFFLRSRSLDLHPSGTCNGTKILRLYFSDDG